MKKLLVPVLALAVLTVASGAQVPSAPALPSDGSTVTFNKDVLPILQRDCQVCHRPGEVAPMSFLTYESTRPWAKAIKQAVLTRKMPPWFADRQHGPYRNAPKLTETDIKVLAAWADNGAPEGDAKDRPAPVEWVDGWRIKPDVIVSMREPFHIPAKGRGEVIGFDIPNPFSQDTWVTSIEIRPGDRSVVHHAALQLPETAPTPTRFTGVTTPPFAPESQVLGPTVAAASEGYYGIERRMETSAPPEAIYVPGSPPMDFRIHNAAKLIPAGARIRLEMHYTPNGKTPATDRTQVGFTVAKKPPERRFVTLTPGTMVNPREFRIPAGAANWEAIGELTFTQNADIVWLMPHLHLRGKDMTYRLIYPNGRTETLLSAKFDFNWQLGYDLEEPVQVRRGAKMQVIAHWDNSAGNKHNPDPSRDVPWGELTSEEMMIPWFGVVVDMKADPKSIFTTQASNNSASSPRIGVSGPRNPAETLPAIIRGRP